MIVRCNKFLAGHQQMRRQPNAAIKYAGPPHTSCHDAFVTEK
jgi:hypothetical protein